MSVDAEALELARGVRDRLAGPRLPASLAKLYSQHTRLAAGQPGLTAWRAEEAGTRLDDAVRLVDASLLEREAGRDTWTVAMRRAAEILEWLAHPQLNPLRMPLRLLSAAAYQLAQYPARSAALLGAAEDGDDSSQVLKAFLAADFRHLMSNLSIEWAVSPTNAELPPDQGQAAPLAMHRWITQEAFRAFGVITAFMRWGEDARAQDAARKLSAIASLLLHDRDPYSWLLGKLTAEVASSYLSRAMRMQLAGFARQLNPTGQTVLERLLRAQYLASRTLAWPSQMRGIERLLENTSFVLCTPTGSGKTAVAELAILKSLFPARAAADSDVGASSTPPIALYLTPSRALAAEIEAQLASALRRVSQAPIVVSALYGGADWGPAEVWLSSPDPTVLICTYEKADALLRFLGGSVIQRLAVVVIDEAHAVQFSGDTASLRSAESRALRLEALATRLLVLLATRNRRVVALSAVAAGIEAPLAAWIEQSEAASPVRSLYRSTRQLVGRLECGPTGRLTIRYDLLDGVPLQFTEAGRADGPFIPNPYPEVPIVPGFQGAEKRWRPHAFWAALHMAAQDEKGQQHTVLISVTQNIGGHAEDLLRLLDGAWPAAALPRFFTPPDVPENRALWDRCLRSCEDYYGRESREYRLLEKGIVVHHGKMPGVLSRALVNLIRERVVYIVLATSTLSEGVNLPFETVLIPTLRRHSGEMSFREFSNLVGRAGRPGFGTEGRSLVVLPQDGVVLANPQEAAGALRARKRYVTLVREFAQSIRAEGNGTLALSPIGQLVQEIEDQWQLASGSSDRGEFLRWLEETAPLALGDATRRDALAVEALDALDAILLPVLEDAEAPPSAEGTQADLEMGLKAYWQASYARYASKEENRLAEAFVHRGLALRRSIYREGAQRRSLYRTGLPPRAATELLELSKAVLEHLRSGEGYAGWDAEKRFEFIAALIGIFQENSRFSAPATPSRVRWQVILRWWLTPSSASEAPTPKSVSKWHEIAAEYFSYRVNWRLGSIFATLADQSGEGSEQDWLRTGLPWSALWLKELLAWGTVEPVAAHLLARGAARTRSEAEARAMDYYREADWRLGDELLSPMRVREWAERVTTPPQGEQQAVRPPAAIPVTLLRVFPRNAAGTWRVIPVEARDGLYWYDPAGYPLAKSDRPREWGPARVTVYDFRLDLERSMVLSQPYL